MELWDGEVRLSRRERKVLCPGTRSVSAERIGPLWRAALEATDDRLERQRNEPQKTYIVMGALGMVHAYTPAHVSIRSLERERHVLSAMEANVLGIERDTLPLETEQQQDL